MDYYKIGQRIRKYRKEQGISQEELAECAGISTTHMSHIETGNTKLSLPVLVDLAAALHVRTDDLLNDQHSTTEDILKELSAILTDCSNEKARIIADTAKALKQSIDKHL